MVDDGPVGPTNGGEITLAVCPPADQVEKWSHVVMVGAWRVLCRGCIVIGYQ
jgi:hypothetical protein